MSVTYVCVDLETTGVTPEKNEIIEIGAVKICDGVIIDKFESLVRPKRPVPPFIYKLTGINQWELEEAPLFHEIYKAFLDFLGNSVFVAHNVDFDFNMINTALTRLKLKRINNPVIDTKDLATIICPDFHSHKLTDLAGCYRVQVWEKHRALSDAECLAKIFLAMQNEMTRINPIILREGLRLLNDKRQGLRNFFSGYYNASAFDRILDYKDFLTCGKKEEILINQNETQEFSKEAVLDFFDKNSEIWQKVESFEPRPSQKKIADFISECFNNSEHAVIEAGTGSGKTMAYLVPAILWAVSEKKPVIISTRTKHLQDQLCMMELPRILQILKPTINFVVIKGKENYVDIRRFDLLYKYYLRNLPSEDVLEFLGLLFWILKTKTGDLSELHNNIYNQFLHKIRFNSDLSHNKRNKRCFLRHIKKRVKEADLVVTNHSLVFSDLAAGAQILPDTPYIIFDEAHSLEDVATQSFAVEYNNQRFKNIISSLTDKKRQSFFEQLLKTMSFFNDKHIKRLESNISRLKQVIQRAERDQREFMGASIKILKENSSEKFKSQIFIDEDVLLSHSWQEVVYYKESLLKHFQAIFWFLNICSEIFEQYDYDIVQEVSYMCENIKDLVEKIQDSLNFLFLYEPNYANWFEGDKNASLNSVKLISAPINCHEIIARSLLQEKQSLVFISATLRTKDSFDFFLRRIGLENSGREYKTLFLKSDFNYPKQAIFGLISDLSEYSYTDRNIDEISTMVSKIVKEFEGKSLALMTSYWSMNQVYEKLRKYLKKTSIQILCQNKHGSRESILKRFRNLQNQAVILGVDSFWEGIDIIGKALSCVILTKLPFPVPTEPLHRARIQTIEKNGGNGFMDYILPLAVLKFKQGVGRLIRSKQDRGVIFIMDDRIKTKSYGRFFINEVADYNIIEAPFKDLLEETIAWYYEGTRAVYV